MARVATAKGVRRDGPEAGSDLRGPERRPTCRYGADRSGNLISALSVPLVTYARPCLLSCREGIPRLRTAPLDRGGHVGYRVPVRNRLKHVWSCWAAVS